MLLRCSCCSAASSPLFFCFAFQQKAYPSSCFRLLSWIFFPQFIASVETANEDRMMMELPTKWDDAPLGVALRALRDTASLSKAAVADVFWSTVSTFMMLGGTPVLVSASAGGVASVVTPTGAGLELLTSVRFLS